MLKEILEKETKGKVEWNDESLAKGIYNGIEFRLMMSGRGYYPDIGSSSHSFDGIELSDGENKIYKEYNDDIKTLVSKEDIAALNFRRGRNVGIGFPVSISKASSYFKGSYNSPMEEDELLKISSKLGHKQTYKKLAKIIPNIINMFTLKVEGAFFFNKEQQKTYKDEVKNILIKNGLKITAETKSVIEFEGSILFTKVLDKIVGNLNNGSYYEQIN